MSLTKIGAAGVAIVASAALASLFDGAVLVAPASVLSGADSGSVPSVSCRGLRMWRSCCAYSSLQEESSKTSGAHLTRSRAARPAPYAIPRRCVHFFAVRSPQLTSDRLWKEERPLLADA